MNAEKLLQRALRNPSGLRFDELVQLVEAFGFHRLRQKGSHHIFAQPQVRELVNIQDVHGMVKAYQVRQFLKLVEGYDLELGGEP